MVAGGLMVLPPPSFVTLDKLSLDPIFSIYKMGLVITASVTYSYCDK